MDIWTYLFHVVAAVAIVAVGFVLGRVVKKILERGLARLGFNDWFRNFNIGRALLRSGYTAGEFFGSITAWIIYITSILLAVAYLGFAFDSPWLYQWALDMVNVYVYGFVKFFIIALVGFILVDGFVEYIYKGAIFRVESVIGPVAEYIRIILYLVVITFALEQGGINVSTLSAMLTPITWGLAIAVVAVLVLEALKRK